MKKAFIAICLSLSILLQSITIPVKAETIITHYIEDLFEDGSYIEVIIEENYLLSRASTKTGSKLKTFKTSSGEVLWSIRVNGTFTYDGTSATCTSSTYTTALGDNYWKLSNANSWRSAATAYASVVAKEYTMLGVLLQTRTETVSLTCSPSGVLS